MLVNFKPIENTKLEVGSTGTSGNRMVFIKLQGECEPLAVAGKARIVMIGHPESEIRAAMKDGRFSRSVIDNAVNGMSGSSYHKLREYLDSVVS